MLLHSVVPRARVMVWFALALLVRSSVLAMSIFFFSSRRRHTRCLSDWSSDVCSSDLLLPGDGADGELVRSHAPGKAVRLDVALQAAKRRTVRLVRQHGPRAQARREQRSEERRVGKECRSRWSPYH